MLRWCKELSENALNRPILFETRQFIRQCAHRSVGKLRNLSPMATTKLKLMKQYLVCIHSTIIDSLYI